MFTNEQLDDIGEEMVRKEWNPDWTCPACAGANDEDDFDDATGESVCRHCGHAC